jgi:hypothetical protein
MGLKDDWNTLNDINDLVGVGSPAAINQMIGLVNSLNQPNTGTSMDASAGVFLSVPIAESAIALSLLGLGYAGLNPTADTLNLDPNPLSPTFVGNNNTTTTALALRAYEPTASFATSFFDVLFIGANVKEIYGSTYVDTENMRTTSYHDFRDNMEQSRTDKNAVSVDAGILIIPVPAIRIGVVGRDLNGPSFPVLGSFAQKLPSGDVTTVVRTDEIKLDPQYRAGVAWMPISSFTLTADYDLTKNKTLVPGFESRQAAVGLEKTFFAKGLSMRLGAHKNLADGGERAVYTAGLGFRIAAFRMDLAAGYDFNERQAEASVDLALRF